MLMYTFMSPGTIIKKKVYCMYTLTLYHITYQKKYLFLFKCYLLSIV